ncbi:MAG: hypothetical protein JNK87_41590 [Bryobacterales bacterium]|nr:hypothetical protein [Bryobacterales bacterium]
MQLHPAAERIRAAQSALERAAAGGWADPAESAIALREALSQLEAAAAIGASSALGASSELQSWARQLRQAAAAHDQAAQVHDGLLRTFCSSLHLDPGASYGADGSAPALLPASGLRLAVEG